MNIVPSNIKVKEDQPNLDKRRLLKKFGLILGGLTVFCLAPKIALSAAGSCQYPELKESDLIVRRPCVLSELLDNVSGGWSRWQNFPNLGDGILSIPRLGITDGLCTITVNNTLIEGPGINVDTISLSPGDNLVIRPI